MPIPALHDKYRVTRAPPIRWAVWGELLNGKMVFTQCMEVNELEYNKRLKALAERSSYVENVLRHTLIAELSSVVWSRDPSAALQVFNTEVDDAGFDIVLGFGSQVHCVQLKQTHDQKVPSHCSVRLSFSDLPGSCVVLMSHTIPGAETH